MSCLILAACSGGGGGGGGSSSATAAPNILAGVISFPATNVPDGFVSAGFNTAVSVSVQDSSSGAPITNASVSVNTVPLAYNSAYQDYEGEISLNPAGSVSLSVTVGSTTYTASGAQFTSYPTITSPLAGITWLSLDSNLVAWSGVAPTSSSLYALGIIDTNGELLWPSGGSFQVLPTTTTSYAIAPYSLTAGNRLVIVGVNKLVDIPDADPNSGLVIGGYNYVPITVIDRQIATLLSIAVTPINPTITVGKAQQLTATGSYSDGSSQDLTTQVSWLSSDPTKATVSSMGLVTGQNDGSTTISATYGGISGSTSVTVIQQTPLSIAVTPNNPTVTTANTLQLTATGNYSGGSTKDLTTQVTWQSSDPTKVTVSATGLIAGQSAGSSATITATYGSISGSTLVNVFQLNPSPTPPLSQTVAYQIDYAHSGTAVFPGSITFPSNPAWSVTLNGAISYPLIADGKVYVTTSDSVTGSKSLYAFDVQTGAIAWGPIPISGIYGWSTSAYDHGKIFVTNFSGQLQSFEAATGTPGWSINLLRTFPAAPTAVNGIVYFGGGGILAAIDEINGSVIWTADVVNGDSSSPAVSSDGVFVSYPCQVYKFDPITGASLWQFSGPCSGGGGKTPAYANGLLYVRDSVMSDVSNPSNPAPTGYIYDATSGTQVGTFNVGLPPAMMIDSAVIPAIGTDTGFFLYNGALQAIDQTSQILLWSFTGDGTLVSAPIVINQDVIIGSSSGNVYAIDATTGSQIWSGNAGSAIAAPQENNFNQPLTGFGAGEGYLVVPAGNVLTAWKLSGP